MRPARPLSVGLLAAALGAPGCEEPPAVLGTVLVADSKSRGDLFRLRLPAGRAERALPLAAVCGDLARGPEGAVYLAAGTEVLAYSAARGALPIARAEGRVDSVLPAADGRRLYILEHPRATPGDDDGGGGPGERTGPHRLRLWDLGAARWEGEVELHPLAYEIHEARLPAAAGEPETLILATHLQGRRVELVRAGPPGLRGEAEELPVPRPAHGPANRQALIRAAQVEPGGRWALLVENGAGGEAERVILWTLDLASRRFTSRELSARGRFQGGVLFLDPAPGGSPRALLNGLDRLLVVRGDPERGFVEENSLPLPALFRDLRRIAAPRPARAAGAAAEVILLSGADPARTRGLVVAVDPGAGRLLRTWPLPAPVDLLEIE